MNTVLESAKHYLNNNWSVIPVPYKSKIPIIKWAEFQNRKPAEEELKEWFENKKSNIALVCGKLSGIVIIDCDPGCDYAMLDLPETLSVKTGRGGKHFYFKYPKTGEIKSKQGIKPNVEVKSDGCLATLPPSVHENGNTYLWELTSKGSYIAELPKWVTEESNAYSSTPKDWEKIMKGSPDGYRGNDAAIVAGKFLEAFAIEDWKTVAWEGFLGWAQRCNPPLEMFRARSTFDSIARRELLKREKSARESIEKENTINTTSTEALAPAEIFFRIGQAKAFIKEQPIYYSPEGLFWLWNKERYCYEMKDETDILNGIRNQMKIDTVDSKTRTEIVSALKQVGREQAPIEKPKGWIQFQNVLVNPKTLEKIEASSKYFLTNPIPHKLGSSEETPELDKLLHEWVVKEGVQDASYAKSLYEYMAYSLTDDLFMQRIIALTGGGSNGKGTFLRVIEKLVGTDNCASISLRSLSANNFATSAIYKKLVAFAGEVGYSDLKNTNILKLLAGEDAIRYEFKGKNSFTAQSITTIFIATNSLPTTPDRSLGFYRRWTITDFPNVFGIKPDVISVISETEYENLCLKCVNTLKYLYETCKFTNEGNYEDREKKYEERSNPLPTFIEENCEEVVGDSVRLQEFCLKFNEWLKTRRLRLVNTRQVGQMLRNEGYTVGKRHLEDPSTSVVAIVNFSFKPKDIQTTETTGM